MKYAIIETWNGEGYSSENLAYIEDYNSDAEAQQKLRDLFSIQSNATNVTESEGLISYDKHDDSGTFQFIKNAESIYGVVILTNVNEVVAIRNKKDWLSKINIAVQQSDSDETDELDLSSDNIFIGAYEGDYDYQFIKF